MVSLSFPFGVTLFLAVIGFFAGRAKATSSVNGNLRLLQALPQAYGQTVLFATLIPASLLLFGWAFVVRILGPDFAVLPDFVFQGLVIAMQPLAPGFPTI